MHEKCKKAKYDTRRAAQKALSRIKNDYDVRDKTPIRVYFCEPCNKFHLTSQEKHPIERQHDVKLKFKNQWNKLLQN